jgi:hypothetical protein
MEFAEIVFHFNRICVTDSFAAAYPARLGVISCADGELKRRNMIDVDRPFRRQDPLDHNARSGLEGSGVGTWSLEFSTQELTYILVEHHQEAVWRFAGAARQLRSLPFHA